MKKSIESQDSLNLLTLSLSLSLFKRKESLKLFIKHNDSITKNHNDAHLTILYSDGGENIIYHTNPGEHEITTNGNILQFTTEFTHTPTNYMGSLDIHIQDIIAIDLNE